MSKRWTEDELELLEELSGKLSLEAVARELGRSPNAVFLKRQRIGIGGYLQNTDLLARNTICRILGVDTKALIRWERFGLKPRKKGPYRMYRQSAILNFLKDHPELWNATKVTDTTIFAECKWFKDKQLCDVQRKRNYFWPLSEIAKVNYLRHEGYSVAEIARRLGRTPSSVKYILYAKQGGKK